MSDKLYQIQSPDASEYWIKMIKCQDACPVHTNAGMYVAAIADGEDELAYLTARLPNPFASVCGRVCAAPCEDACRRGFSRAGGIWRPDHGRNARGWRSGNMQMQFDYDYSDEELQEWVDKIIAPMARQAGSGTIFFNNHVRAQAPKNARRLISQLIERGLL